ncbi:MAG: efflux RND transporter periplasmic adaptor subunit [Myxococcaceae bacterium]|nr:MAG: efflux RND transporter periplasmic adaptor subunit [Myxococcaceae bacterium]
MRLRPTLAAAALAAACQRTAPSAPHAAHPATVAHAVKESELTTVTLTPRAVERLGITTAPVAPASGAQVRTFAGDVSVPPGRALTLAAPLAGTVHAPASGLPRPGTAVAQGALLLWLTPFAPADRDVRAQSVRTLEAARARLAASTQRAARTELLARQRAGSERAAEEARAERDTAAAEVRAAEARLAVLRRAPLDSDVRVPVTAPRAGVVRQLFAAPGQMVAAGGSLVEVAAADALWVRVPVYAGDLASLDAQAPARVARLGEPSTSAGTPADPVVAPPSADPVAATVDLFYALSPGASALRQGERVRVSIPGLAPESALSVPWSAVITDVSGGQWVYELTGPGVYARKRVAVLRVEGDRALLSRGPRAGTPVVAVGAAELYGTEFGAGH